MGCLGWVKRHQQKGSGCTRGSWACAQSVGVCRMQIRMYRQKMMHLNMRGGTYHMWRLPFVPVSEVPLECVVSLKRKSSNGWETCAARAETMRNSAALSRNHLSGSQNQPGECLLTTAAIPSCCLPRCCCSCWQRSDFIGCLPCIFPVSHFGGLQSQLSACFSRQVSTSFLGESEGKDTKEVCHISARNGLGISTITYQISEQPWCIKSQKEREFEPLIGADWLVNSELGYLSLCWR